MTGDNVYVYGIIEADDLDLELDGVAGADRVTTVTFRNLSAVVSEIDTTDPEQTDEDVQAHDEVLRAVLEHGGGRTVVPMSYGMAFKDVGTLKSVLRNARRAFTKALRDVDGTVELGLKLVTAEDATVDREAVTRTVDERLDPLSVNRVENDMFSDRLVVNNSYLVDREDRETFDEAVGALEDELGDEVLVQYTGPWAPYNFVDIRIGAKQ